jgi:type IV secretion system protein VirB4
LVFASQSPADVANSKLFDVIKESCFTKIFLPNPTALEQATADFYRRFSLNERQIEIIAQATPKREYYVTSPAGNRLFSLALGEIGLAYCAATGDADVKRAEPLLERSTEDFNREWVALKNLGWVGDLMYGTKRRGAGAAAA